MASPRRAISNLGDVQLALNDVFTLLENLTSKPYNFNKRIVTGIPDPKADLDAVNLEFLKAYVEGEVEKVIALIPPKVPQQPLNAVDLYFSKNLLPKVSIAFSVGSAALLWLKGWFADVHVDNLTASKPVRSDASKNLVTGNLLLATEVTGVLPRANGGLANAAVAPYAGTISGTTATGTFAGTITGTANLITGAVTGTCSGTTSADAVTGTSSTNI